MSHETGVSRREMIVTTRDQFISTVLLCISVSVTAAGENDIPGDVTLMTDIDGVSISDIDTSKWRCKYCPDPADKPWDADANIGLGYVTNDSFKFGEYNGHSDSGAFLILDIDAIYRDNEADYIDFRSDGLGLDNRRVDFEAGKQGAYRINLILDQITRHNLDTARSPYTGTTNQILPASWIPASTTSAMTSLSTDLRSIDFSTERDLLKLGSNVVVNPRWNFDVEFERQIKEGELPTGAAIGTTFADARSVILAKPLDFVTDRFDLSANYRNKDITGSLSFVFSAFKNSNDALRWENAFTTGSNVGQMALEPDNQMQQITAQGQYRGIRDVVLNGSLSFARMIQDQNFLPYTINNVLTPPQLPVNSLNGSIDVAQVNTNANWTISDKSLLKFSYDYLEQVNDTDRSTYTYVVADNATTGIPRANFPYDFRTQKFKAETSYLLDHDDKLAGGVEYGLYDRTYQEVDRSTETRLWGKYTKQTLSNINYSLLLESGTRKADSYNVLTELSPPENPQLRKYNLADKDTLGATIDVGFSVGEQWLLNLNMNSLRADYSNSSVGLKESDDLTIGVNAQYRFSDAILLTGYLQQSVMKSSQNGSSTASDPNWSARNRDTVNSLGFGLGYAPEESDFRYGVDYFHNTSTGQINFSDPSLASFPDLESKIDNITLHVDFDYSEKLVYKLAYAYEVYKETNWNLDGVSQSTIDNVLVLGETSPDYRIGVIWASIKYAF